MSQKVRENRLRRMAQRQGLELQKSRARDPRALGFGGYMLVEVRRNAVVAGAEGHAYSLTLDEAEHWLTTGTLADELKS